MAEELEKRSTDFTVSEAADYAEEENLTGDELEEFVSGDDRATIREAVGLEEEEEPAQEEEEKPNTDDEEAESASDLQQEQEQPMRGPSEEKADPADQTKGDRYGEEEIRPAKRLGGRSEKPNTGSMTS